jgi:hypothetical protein
MTDKYIESLIAAMQRAKSLSRMPSVEQKGSLRDRAQPVIAVFDETLLLSYFNSRPESKEARSLISQIEASRRRSQRTQREIAKLRKQNQAMLAKL